MSRWDELVSNGMITLPRAHGAQPFVPVESDQPAADTLDALRADRRGLRPTDVRALLERVAIVALGDDVAQRAIDIRSGLRTLDALHLASAVVLGPIVTEFLSYDRDLNEGALAHGIPLHILVEEQ